MSARPMHGSRGEREPAMRRITVAAVVLVLGCMLGAGRPARAATQAGISLSPTAANRITFTAQAVVRTRQHLLYVEVVLARYLTDLYAANPTLDPQAVSFAADNFRREFSRLELGDEAPDDWARTHHPIE